MPEPINFPTPMNPLQRWFLERSRPRYDRLPDDLRPVAIARDHYLLDMRASGLWLGLLFGIAGTTFGLVAQPEPTPLWLAFAFALGIFAGLFKAGVSAWLRPERFTGRRLWRLFWLVLVATYASALTAFGGRLHTLIDNGLPWHEALMRVVWRATPLQFIAFVGVLLLLSIISTARGQVLQRALRALQAEQARDAAVRQLAQARLSLLQAQIQPHFLFNTLSALQHWVDVGDPRAGPLLRALTGFLRGASELMLQSSVTLAQECNIVRHYLQIMRSRLGERLRFVIDVAPDCEAQTLPPGLLITLVENAVEHGIEPQLRGGEVRVQARRSEGVFELRVRDDGVGLVAGADEGIGLSNSRARLQHAFGGCARLQLKPRSDGPGTEVLLQLFEPPREALHTAEP